MGRTKSDMIMTWHVHPHSNISRIKEEINIEIEHARENQDKQYLHWLQQEQIRIIKIFDSMNNLKPYHDIKINTKWNGQTIQEIKSQIHQQLTLSRKFDNRFYHSWLLHETKRIEIESINLISTMHSSEQIYHDHTQQIEQQLKLRQQKTQKLRQQLKYKQRKQR
jgi:hypothetical protein